jgi:hypothetical protein
MMKVVLFSLVMISAAALADYPQPKGLWLFDDPDHLTQSVVGSELVEAGTHTAVAGTSAGDGAVADGIGSYYICSHSIAPNGGGSYVNNWTLLLDIKLPTSSAGNWVSLYQTNSSNANDGDCFISTSRTIGVGATGYTSRVIQAQIWYRVVISVSNNYFYRIYVNGEKWLEGTVQSLDGRFSLDPTILLFADESGEDYPIHCTTSAIWGQALNDSQVSSLGNAYNPIQIPAAPYAGLNLLANPSGEDEMSGWTIDDGADWQATDRTDWHFPLRGNYYFTPGRTASGEISQTINLSFMAAQIDSGIAIVLAEGFLGGRDQDQGRLLVEYLDGDYNPLTASDSGWIAGPGPLDWTAADLQDPNGLILPAGTRFVKYRFLAQRLEGVDCDAFGDHFAWEFRLADPVNGDPSVPSITASGSGTFGVSVPFTFASTDPDADTVSYQTDWGDTISSWSTFIASGTNYATSHAWPILGSYSVRVRARDEHGAVGEWSGPFVITISGEAAGIFNSQPYLQNVSPEAITIAWESDRAVFPKVDWGLTDAYGQQAEGLCLQASSGVYFCKVRISGLSPQTTYHFRARNGTTLGADGVFQTAPDTEAPFAFNVWGDSQRETVNPACSQAMFSAMAAADTAFGVVVGDTAEDSGYGYYSNPFRKYLLNVMARRKPVFIAFGNHDEPSTSLVHTAIQNAGMHSFSFNYSNAHFTCIDYSQCNDGTLPDDGSINSLPLEWIQQDLASDAAQQAAWRFLFIHIPPYSERWFDGSSLLRTYLVPLMNQYRVQMCFSGHTHEYERGVLNGTYYVMTGCGSYLDTAELIVRNWAHMTVGGVDNIGPFTGGCVNGYTDVTIDGTKLTLTQHAYYANGTYYGLIDTVRIRQADFTGDGAVDLEDFALLAGAWGTTPQDTGWNPDCDLADRAGAVIDLGDLEVFVQYWLEP